MAIAAINEQNLQDIAKDIMNYVDSINDILNKYDDKFYSISSYYEGKSYNDLKNFYSNVRNKFPIVKKNLMTYSDDFIALIRKMNEAGSEISKMFNQYTEDTNAQTRKIDETFLKGN